VHLYMVILMVTARISSAFSYLLASFR